MTRCTAYTIRFQDFWVPWKGPWNRNCRGCEMCLQASLTHTSLSPCCLWPLCKPAQMWNRVRSQQGAFEIGGVLCQSLIQMSCVRVIHWQTDDKTESGTVFLCRWFWDACICTAREVSVETKWCVYTAVSRLPCHLVWAPTKRVMNVTARSAGWDGIHTSVLGVLLSSCICVAFVRSMWSWGTSSCRSRTISACSWNNDDDADTTTPPPPQLLLLSC
jgi:hypothetical protein